LGNEHVADGNTRADHHIRWARRAWCCRRPRRSRRRGRC
jgi:hypothetical protein